jgi:hypothetical protein
MNIENIQDSLEKQLLFSATSSLWKKCVYKIVDEINHYTDRASCVGIIGAFRLQGLRTAATTRLHEYKFK